MSQRATGRKLQSRPMDLDQGLRATEIYCARRVAPELREKIRVECSRRGQNITITERRPPWHEDETEWSAVKVAQLRHDPEGDTWTLHCSDSGGRWFLYDDVAPASTVAPLLVEIEEDPTGIFWG